MSLKKPDFSFNIISSALSLTITGLGVSPSMQVRGCRVARGDLGLVEAIVDIVLLFPTKSMIIKLVKMAHNL